MMTLKRLEELSNPHLCPATRPELDELIAEVRRLRAGLESLLLGGDDDWLRTQVNHRIGRILEGT